MLDSTIFTAYTQNLASNFCDFLGGENDFYQCVFAETYAIYAHLAYASGGAVFERV